MNACRICGDNMERSARGTLHPRDPHARCARCSGRTTSARNAAPRALRREVQAALAGIG